MKTTKATAIFLMILAIPMFISMVILMAISMDYWMLKGEMMQKLFLGNLNNKFLAIVSLPSVLFFCCLLVFLGQMIKYGWKIDSLEDEKEKYRKAKVFYQKKAGQFIDEFLNKPDKVEEKVKEAEPSETIYLADCSWEKNQKIKREHTYYEIANSRDYGNSRHSETFDNSEDAIKFAKTKIKLSDKKNEDYWNNQNEVVTKVTTIKEIIRVIHSSEKV